MAFLKYVFDNIFSFIIQSYFEPLARIGNITMRLPEDDENPSYTYSYHHNLNIEDIIRISLELYPFANRIFEYLNGVCVE